MRLSSTLSLWPLAFVSSVAAAARHATIHIPRMSDSPLSVTLSPSEARLVLAQRLGLSQYHSLGDANEATLEAINAFAVSEGPFDQHHYTEKTKLLLVIEGLEDPESFLSSSKAKIATLKIDNPPSTDTTSQFLRDLAAQQQQAYSRQSPGYDTNCTAYDLESCLDSWMHAAQYAHAQPPLHHSLSLSDYAKQSAGTSDSSYTTALKRLESALRKHLASNPSYMDITILLMPLAQPAQKTIFSFRNPEQPTWGTYTPTQKHSQQLHRRQDPTSDPSTTDDDKASDDKTTSPPAGILPTCFSSESNCKETTHSCSGHGTCKKLYTVPDPGADEGKECWTCACESTTENTDTGESTTKWAGPACQKKDVSTPFWLLAGASIGLVSAVAFGIGMLMEMGSAELPSVLGAGVSGPGARGK